MHTYSSEVISRMEKRDVAPAREAFRTLAAAILSLILPLSFLLLARLSVVRYLGISASHNCNESFDLCSTFFLFSTQPIIPQLLVSLITLSCLANSLTGKFPRPHLHVAWIVLFFFHICVGMGVEGSIAAGVDGSGFGQRRSFVFRVVFFLGLHESMLFWSRMVVGPVVDDTFSGGDNRQGWAEKAAMGLSLGALWWWGLREEVEAVVVLPEMMGVGVVGFVWWWLYCSTVAIGVVVVIKACFFTTGFIFRGRNIVLEAESRPVHHPDPKLGIEPV